MTIGIILAMEKELEQLLPLLSGLEEQVIHGKKFYTGTLTDGKQVVIQQCGIGKVNAAIGTVEMIDTFKPDCVVSSGVAGGATTKVPRLHVVASSEVVYHDVYCFSDNAYGQIQGMPARFACDERLVNTASTVENVTTGLIASGDWFVDTKQKAGEILDHFPETLAIDMESGAIAQTCHVYSVPFISLRIISDIPLDDSKGEQYFDFWDRIANGSFTVLHDFLTRLTL
jgi:adenosylhomocysteine nucleosidase